MPNFYNKYPYTDFHEINLDWVLETVKQDKETVEQNVQNNEQFKHDITDQQTDFEQGMRDWKTDTINDLNDWKTDTKNEFAGQIDDLEDAYAAFLDNYSRTFGIIDDYGSSTVDAISQAKATETRNLLKSLTTHSLREFFTDYQFSRGGISSGGSILTMSYRIYNTDIQTAASDIIIKALPGWKFNVAYYTGTVFDHITTLDENDEQIPANSNYRIGIARMTEDVSETADYDEFISGIEIVSLTAMQSDMINLKNINDNFIKCDSAYCISLSEFERGNTDSSGNYSSAVTYRITNQTHVMKDYPIQVSAAPGYLYSISFYNSGVFVSHNTFATDPVLIPANTEFALTIRKETETPGTPAARDIFVHGINIIIPVMPFRPMSNYLNVTNKKINFLGDSYVANNNDTFEDTWCYKFAVRHNNIVRNYGQNGVTITPQSSGGTPGSISDRAAVMASADYIVVIGGKNDYNNQIPLATFRTSVSDLIEYLVANFPGSQIAFFTPWKVSEATEVDVGNTSQPLTLFEYIDIIQEECDNHGVACYNTKNSGIYTFDATFRSTYFQSNNDISHLNSDGHDLFLPRAEKFLLNVLK